NGTIELTNTATAARNASLNVTNGTLTNAATRTISVLPGTVAGGTRTLGAQLDNQGTVTLMQALTLGRSMAAHTNSSTINVTGGDLTLSLTGAGATFTNTGMINIGASRTLFVSGGRFNP